MTVCQKRRFRSICGPKAGNRRLKKTTSCEVHTLFAKVIPGWIRWTGHVASM
jgi:hypothetical protein